MKINQKELVGLMVVTIGFMVYWILNPILGFIRGPEYLFSPLWWVAAQIFFMLVTLLALLGWIYKIAEPGEVRWFKNNDLLEIPQKAGKS